MSTCTQGELITLTAVEGTTYSNNIYDIENLLLDFSESTTGISGSGSGFNAFTSCF